MENVISTKALNDEERVLVAEINEALQYLNTQSKYYGKSWKAKIFRDNKVAFREIDKNKQVRHIKTADNIAEARQFAKDTQLAQYIGYKKVHGFLTPEQSKVIAQTKNSKIKQQLDKAVINEKQHKEWVARKKWLANKK